MGKPRDVILWMPSVRPVADASAHHHRDACSSARHVMQVRRLINQLIHGGRQEFAKADFDDRSASEERGAQRGSHHCRFRDRRLQHSTGAKFLVQPSGALHRPAEGTDVLANEEHAWIAAHLERNRVDNRLHVRETTAASWRCYCRINAHANTSSRPSSASLTSAAALARSTAAATSLSA